MAIAFDIVDTGASSAGADFSYTHGVIVSGSDLAAVTGVAQWADPHVAPTVTHGGSAMTDRAGTTSTADPQARIFTRAGIGSGNQTVSVNTTNPIDGAASGSCSFTGVDQTTVVRTSGAANSNTVTLSGMVSGDWAVDSMADYGDTTRTPGADQTERGTVVSGSQISETRSTQTETGGVMSWTGTSASNRAIAATAIIEAAGGGGGSNIPKFYPHFRDMFNASIGWHDDARKLKGLVLGSEVLVTWGPIFQGLIVHPKRRPLIGFQLFCDRYAIALPCFWLKRGGFTRYAEKVPMLVTPMPKKAMRLAA